MAYCSNCRNYVADGSRICPYCHAAIPQAAPNYYTRNPGYNPPPPQPQTFAQPVDIMDQQNRNNLSNANTLGIVSLVLAIIGFHLIAWICGGVGLSKANSVPELPQYANDRHKARLLNIWGIIIPFIKVALALLFYLIVFLIYGASFFSYLY